MVTPRSSSSWRKRRALKSAGSSMASASPKPGSSCEMFPQKVSWLEPGSRLMDTVRAGALRRSHHAVVDFVVLRKRRDAEKRALAGSVGGFDVNEDDIVVDGQC